MLPKLLARFAITCCLSVLAVATPAVAGEVADAINAIADGDHRSEKNRARNEFRHPGETLEFFGILADMTVVEISPGGGGWYTEILAPYLRDKGTYFAGGNDPDSDSKYQQRNAKRYNDKLTQNPELYDRVEVGVFVPPANMSAAPEGSADMVVTFRNTHNWINSDNAEAALKAMFGYLKPGGVLGLVQHRSDPGPTDADRGYVNQQMLIELAESAGFTFEASSEINANPNDSKDHPKGVWNLPPSYTDGDQDREKYAAIGESDRMTLRFRKPEA